MSAAYLFHIDKYDLLYEADKLQSQFFHRFSVDLLYRHDALLFHNNERIARGSRISLDNGAIIHCCSSASDDVAVSLQNFQKEGKAHMAADADNSRN
jgi:hypothetical protein